VIYLYFDGLQQRLRRRRSPAGSTVSAAPRQLGSVAHE